MEIGTVTWVASRRITGRTRRNSSSSLTGSAPGRVDSPPTSIISAPCANNSIPCAAAAALSRNCPPSENESGVTLTIPITMAGRGNTNSNSRARRIIRPTSALDHLTHALHEPAPNRGHEFVRHTQLWVGALTQHVALVVHVINQHKLARLSQRDLAREESHPRQRCDAVNDVAQRCEGPLFFLRPARQAVTVGETIPPAAPNRAEHVKDPKVGRLAIRHPRGAPVLHQIMSVPPQRHRSDQVPLTGGIHDNAAFAVTHARLNDERRAQNRALLVRQHPVLRLLARHDQGEWEIESGGCEARMQARLVESG